MRIDKSSPLIEEYLLYLTTIKGRGPNTIIEYRIDLTLFFSWLSQQREFYIATSDLSFVTITFIKSISISDMYSFLAHCQNERHSSAGTRARKIVSIRQFWRYLHSKAHLLECNIAEQLETPKRPKRSPKYLTLEESVRLLLASKVSPRDHCIITLFLNCALRLSELASIDVSQVGKDALSVIGKGNKERRVFLTPACKHTLSHWLAVRGTLPASTEPALFLSRYGNRVAVRSIQNIVKKSVALAGLDPSCISVHKLRHTAATLMYKYGHADIRSLQQILGHESIATTEIYTHIYDLQMQTAVNSNPLSTMFQ